MPQIPDLIRPVTAVNDTAHRVASELAEQGRETTGDLLGRAADVKDAVTGAFGQVLGGVVRTITAPALEELFDELNDHDERVRDAVREELQVFATVVGDGMFALAVPDGFGSGDESIPRSQLEYLGDEIDLEGFDDLDYADG